MHYKLTERGKEIYRELEQDRSRAAYNLNLAIALQAVVDVAEDGIVSEAEIQRTIPLDLVTIRQLMTILLMLHLIEPVDPTGGTQADA